jgi:serine/threonine protein kinase/Tol biopolymer transport system component
MTPEHWRQIESLFHSARALPPQGRASYLEHACAGDEALRREVEALLASHEDAGSFINAPAISIVSEQIANEQAHALVGRIIGHYKILELIGTGGMGEVYLAEDIYLGRKAALKLLPATFTRDETRVRRFQQEARAASALNHPNILTIYEIGESGGAQFIATEYITGETLRGRMAHTRLSLLESLDLATQVASALSAAHASGIAHRDIKPENVMLRPDGYLKVLDFGLAKLTEREAIENDPEAPTKLNVNTAPGLIMGTASYMSPEQARGLRVDARTDVWSLGVMLYEMIGGRVPFEGETPSDAIAALLKTEPPPLSRYAPETPPELQRIVSKTLRKDREERYQTIKDVALDLREIREELAFTAKLERSAAPEKSHEALNARNDEQAIVAAASQHTTSTAEVGQAQTTSSAEYLVGEIKRHKRSALLILAAACVAATSLGLYKFFHRPASANRPVPFQNVKISKLTNNGRATRATISPDGKYVAYEMDEEDGRAGLQLRQLATNTTLQIVAPTKSNFSGLTFSRDGNLIYFVMGNEAADDAALYQVPILGGTAKKVLTLIDGPVTFAPDGRRFAYVHYDRAQLNYNLMIADTDGTNAHPLISRKDLFLMKDGPAWSPDGKIIILGASTEASGFYNQELYAFEVEGGAVKQLTSKKWRSVNRACWLEDGSGLVFLAAAENQDDDRTQLWHVSYPSGAVNRITNDTHAHGINGLGLTADARTIVTIEADTEVNIWTLPSNGDAGKAKQVLSRAGYGGIAWTPDGNIIYSSPASGTQDIWLANADGSNQKQLTSDAARDYKPVVSHDGRYVVFESVRSDSMPHLWRMDIDGGNLKQLTNTEDYSPSITPDDRWVVYVSWSMGRGLIWKVPLDGGTPVQLTDYLSDSPKVSPDGKFITYMYYEREPPKRWRNAIISIDGGPPLKVFDRPQYEHQEPGWAADGRSLLFIGAPVHPANIWLQPVDGSPPKQVTNFTAEDIFRFAPSPDGKQLAVGRGQEIRDVILISDSR